MTFDRIDVLYAGIVASLPAIGAGLLVFVIFGLLAGAARGLIRRVRDRSALKSHRELLDLAAVVVFWAIVVLGAVIGFGTMGINVEALVAGLGITGFALGFALKDMIANFLAGVLILAFRPFNYGDRIKVTGFEGDVIHIDLRYTEIRDGANRHLIPNQTMYSSPVTICSRTEPVVAAEG